MLLQELIAIGPQLPGRGVVAVEGLAGVAGFFAQDADFSFFVPVEAMASRATRFPHPLWSGSRDA